MYTSSVECIGSKLKVHVSWPFNIFFFFFWWNQMKETPLKARVKQVLTWRWTHQPKNTDELDHTHSPQKQVTPASVLWLNGARLLWSYCIRQCLWSPAISTLSRFGFCLLPYLPIFIQFAGVEPWAFWSVDLHCCHCARRIKVCSAVCILMLCLSHYQQANDEEDSSEMRKMNGPQVKIVQLFGTIFLFFFLDIFYKNSPFYYWPIQQACHEK